MAILVLMRHGRTTANASGTLAGWTPGIGLDDVGKEQAKRVAERLRGTRLTMAALSPLQRCQETGETVLRHQEFQVETRTVEGIGEAKYGAWTGRPLKELSKESLWKDVQSAPSTVTYPPSDDFENESMSAMQQRAVAAIKSADAEVEKAAGPGGVWLAVSHGDVIKAILAEAVGTNLDDFQRIMVDPASVSIIRYTSDRSYVVRMNDTGSDEIDLQGLSKAASTEQDAAVGGGAGH